MKTIKYVPIVVAACAAAAVFGGCATENDAKYDELNAKLKLDYSQIVLTVTDTIDEETVLTSEYTMNFITGGNIKVNYSVERFSEVSLGLSADEKITLTGEALVMGGDVIYIDGDEVTLDALVDGKGLDFHVSYFANADLTESYFKADVTNPGGFLGSSLSCSDMKVNAVFGTAFSTINITYKAQAGNKVEYLYAFTI